MLYSMYVGGVEKLLKKSNRQSAARDEIKGGVQNLKIEIDVQH